MTGRGRGRNGKAAANRAGEDAPAPENTMPPPATTRVTRSAQAQSKEANNEPQVPVRQLEIPRRGTRREDRAQSKASVASISSLRSARTGTDFFQSQQSQEPQVAASDVSEDDDNRDRETTAVSVVESPAQQKARFRLMNKFLERLYTSARDLLDHLIEPDQDDVWHAELPAFRGAFNSDREHYYREGSPYFLDLNYVLESLQADLSSTSGLAAARVIAAENVVSYLANIKATTLSGPESEMPLTMLQAMDNALGKVLVSLQACGIPRWADDRDRAALELALELRTQLFIATYKQFGSQQEDPLGLLAHVFCHPNAVENADDEGSLRGLLDRGPYARLMGTDVNLAVYIRNHYQNRIKAILGTFEYEGNDRYNIIVTRLESEFSYDGFVDDVEDWVRETFDHIEDVRMNRNASQQSPSLALGPREQSMEQSQADDSQTDSDLNSQPIVRGPPNSSALLTSDSILRLKQLESGSVTIPPSNQRAAANGSSSASLWHQAATPGPSNNGTLYAESAANSAKRPYVVGDGQFDNDDDDAFETDNRAPSSQRRAQAPGRQRTSPKRVRIAPGETEMLPPPTRPRVAPSSAPPRPSASASALGASQKLPPPPPSTEPDLLQLSQMSRQISIAHRRPREPQRRQAWSRDDTKTLIRAVYTYECKWALIARLAAQRQIPFDHVRDQQALRDKARLVKVDFLKTDSVLPPGFDGVVLGQKERRIVVDCGRNPDRKEADIDPETNLPTNTVYVEDPFA